MRIFKNKSVFKKLIIVFLCIMLISFCVPKSVRAEDFGGKLLNPVMSLFVTLGDGAMALLQKVVFHVDTSLINIDSSADFWAKAIVIIGAVLIAAIAIVATVFSAGAALTVGLVAGIVKITITTAIVTTVTFPITTTIVEGMFPDSFYLPLYSITPEEIFSNKIPLLDVDFFNPSEDKVSYKTETKTVTKEEYSYNLTKIHNEYGFTYNITLAKAVQDYKIEYYNKYPEAKLSDDLDKLEAWEEDFKNLSLTEQEKYLKYFVEMEKKIGGKSINFDELKNTKYKDKITKEVTQTVQVEDGVQKSTARELRSTISTWYNILRDISLVALLSVLVYVGIRILISSTASDKAKYKQMLVDWIVAICLLFFMQYIMSFSNMIVKKITDVIDITSLQAYENDKDRDVERPEVFLIADSEKIKKAYETLVEKPAENGEIASEEDSPYYKYFMEGTIDDGQVTALGEPNGKDSDVFMWPAENFMQQARLNLQLLEDDKDTYVAIGWKLIFVVLVVYTFIFLFTYLKRVVYMAFLTIISPLVALTYPIDKINDGKAQAFNTWFKEYIFNLLIQPMHLVLYTVLISSAMDFASKNIIYVIVALGFMVPAEKLMRKFFGFGKADTPGMFGGPAGAAIIMSGMNKLLGKPAKHGNGNSSKTISNGNDRSDDSKINYKDDFDSMAMLAGGSRDSNRDEEAITNTDKDIKDNENDAYEEFLKDLNNPQNHMPFTQDKEDPALTDPNYMFMHPDEYDEDGNYIGKRASNEVISKPKTNQDLSQVKIREAQTGRTKMPQSSSSKKPRRIARIARGIGNTAKYKGRKIINKAENERSIRKAFGVASGLAGAAVAATAAGMVGIASGDLGKAAQYMGTAAIGGYKLTDGIPGRVADAFKDSNAMDEFKQGYYTEEEYKEKQIQKSIKRAKKDFELDEKLMKKLKDKEKVEKAKDEIIPDCIRYGIDDNNDIAAVAKMVDNGVTKNKAIAAALGVREYGKNTSKLGAKDSEDLDKTLRNRFRQSGIVKEEDINSKVIDARELYDQFSDIKYKK